jgi:tetratricopeptide (TPR) repeat protein
MMVVVILFMAWPILNPPAPGAAGTPVTGSAAGTTDISNMSPREAADRLYNRVMTAVEANDSTQVTTFLPMSIQAYDMARPLDPDGLFHLSRLQRVGEFDAEALAVAEEALAINPDHLLALYAAGDAALAVGEEASARGYFQRLLDVWDAEMASSNQDYQLHSMQMTGIREYAQEVLSGG